MHSHRAPRLRQPEGPGRLDHSDALAPRLGGVGKPAREAILAAFAAEAADSWLFKERLIGAMIDGEKPLGRLQPAASLAPARPPAAIPRPLGPNNEQLRGLPFRRRYRPLRSPGDLSAAVIGR